MKSLTTDANGVITGYGYCECGALLSMTNAVGTAQQEVTSYSYDLNGRRVLTVLPDGTSITNWFDVLGQLTATDDGTGIRAFYYNNNQGLVTNITTWQGDIDKETDSLTAN